MTLPLHRLNFVPEMIEPHPNLQPLLPDRAASRAQFQQPPTRVGGRGRSGKVECKGAIIQHHKLHKVELARCRLLPCREVLTVA
jgi:hypothetical protein